MTSNGAYRGMGWEHGALVVQRYAGMLAPITFVLADGRQVSPMQIAPWTGEPEDYPGVDKKLRGDWACVPFGRGPATNEGWPEAWARHIGTPEPWEMLHGFGSNHNWTWLDSDGSSIRLAIDCPRDNPVKRLERTITPDPAGPAVDIELKVEVWEDVSLPFGVHPTFRLPTAPGTVRIEPGKFREGRTFPASFENSARFAPDRSVEQALQQCSIAVALRRERAIRIESLAGVPRAPRVHQRIRRTRVEAAHVALRRQ